MPRILYRARWITSMRLAVARRMRRRVLRKMKGVVDPMQNMLDEMYFNKLKIAEATRYLYRSKYRTRAFDVFVIDVPEDSIPPSVADSVSDDIGGNPQCENHLSRLNEDKFRRKYRMSRKNFHL